MNYIGKICVGRFSPGEQIIYPNNLVSALDVEIIRGELYLNYLEDDSIGRAFRCSVKIVNQYDRFDVTDYKYLTRIYNYYVFTKIDGK
jgi:hypothetical protein